MLEWQTEELLGARVGRDGIIVHVRPELVVEIALDGVQASTRYPGGVALRFARVRRYRDDKAPARMPTPSRPSRRCCRPEGSRRRPVRPLVSNTCSTLLNDEQQAVVDFDGGPLRVDRGRRHGQDHRADRPGRRLGRAGDPTRPRAAADVHAPRRPPDDEPGRGCAPAIADGLASWAAPSIRSRTRPCVAMPPTSPCPKGSRSSMPRTPPTCSTSCGRSTVGPRARTGGSRARPRC